MSKEGIWKKIYLVYMIHLQCKTKSKQDRSMHKEAKLSTVNKTFNNRAKHGHSQNKS